MVVTLSTAQSKVCCTSEQGTAEGHHEKQPEDDNDDVKENDDQEDIDSLTLKDSLRLSYSVIFLKTIQS